VDLDGKTVMIKLSDEWPEDLTAVVGALGIAYAQLNREVYLAAKRKHGKPLQDWEAEHRRDIFDTWICHLRMHFADDVVLMPDPYAASAALNMAASCRNVLPLGADDIWILDTLVRPVRVHRGLRCLAHPRPCRSRPEVGCPDGQAAGLGGKGPQLSQQPSSRRGPTPVPVNHGHAWRRTSLKRRSMAFVVRTRLRWSRDLYRQQVSRSSRSFCRHRTASGKVAFQRLAKRRAADRA
jgi:hypothetical protein